MPVQLAQAYGLALEDLPPAAQPEVVLLVEKLLGGGGTSSTAVALLIQFPPLCSHFDVTGTLEDLVEGGQLAVASRWAEALGHEFQVSWW